jgi:hypothetical protein
MIWLVRGELGAEAKHFYLCGQGRHFSIGAVAGVFTCFHPGTLKHVEYDDMVCFEIY